VVDVLWRERQGSAFARRRVPSKATGSFTYLVEVEGAVAEVDTEDEVEGATVVVDAADVL